MLLSMIVTVYNTEKYLKRCFESLLSQSFSDFEIIIVDDGSTDGSSEICDEYSMNMNVKVIHQKNTGVTLARLHGLSVAEGQYISFVDSDDWVDADFYKHLIDKGIEYDCDMVVGSLIIDQANIGTPCINTVRNGLYTKQQLQSDYYNTMIFDRDTQLPGILPSLCNKIFKKELIASIMQEIDTSISFGEDALCTYPCMLDCTSLYVVNDNVYYHYVQHSLSVTHSYDPNLLQKFISLSKALRNEFDKRGYDDLGQLYCYITRYSLECMRKELLYHKEISLLKRIEIIKKYINQTEINTAFMNSVNVFDKKMTFKIKLINSKKIFLFYILIKARSFCLQGD